jgi:hypothetical protein
MTDGRRLFVEPYDDSHNWLGLDASAALGAAVLLWVAVYAAKFLIGRLPVRWVRVYWFVLLVTASLPYLWLLVVVDWQNWHVNRVSCWVYYPFGFWVIPTASFAAGANAMRSPSLLWYVGRSCIESLLMVLWVFVWGFFSFIFLGGGWI